jgi:hypothetical protein
MPMHDWTRVTAGDYHHFHQCWTIRLTDALNGGRLPPGYFVLTDQRVEGWEPDVTGLFAPAVRGVPLPTLGGVTVTERPPVARRRSRRAAGTESEAGAYARRANRLVIQQNDRAVVAVIELVSPGNKDRPHSVNRFVEKVRDFLRKGVHVLFVDPFPPGEHDPLGLDAAVWSVWTDTPDERPADKPLTAASYDAGNPFAAYVEPLSVGDPLPEMPLFLQPDIYIPCPLEESYMSTWNALPPQLRDAVTGA